jgi:hypothetical protein
MRKWIFRVFIFLFGGAAYPAILARQWWALVVIVVLYLGLSFRIPRLFLLYGAIHRAGLRMMVPVAPLDGGSLNVEQTKKHVATATKLLRESVEGCREVNLMLCSGYRIIGWHGKPGWLYRSFEDAPPALHLRVLLLDPACESARQRSGQVMQGYEHERYIRGTNAVLWTLRELRSSGRQVEARLYREQPIWQLIMCPEEVFVMSAAEHTATDLSPWWVLRRRLPYGMAHGLEAVWERRWNLSGENGTIEVDWESVNEPDRSGIVDLPPSYGGS